MRRCAAACVAQRTNSTPHDPSFARLASGAFYEADMAARKNIMRDKWYADKRDLVKWGGIMHLLNDKNLGIKKVIQIAYYRNDSWPPLNFNGNNIPIPEKVLKYFRDINLIKKLDPRIKVFDQKFEHKNRQGYTDDLCKRLKKIQEKKIVFLDPDTGLEPKKCKAENVKHREVKQIFDSLEPGDFLVFYQHKFRSSKWNKIRLSELAEACGLSRSKIKTWNANEIANDVIFFFAEKEN
jgi:hypothetical protein